MQLSLNTCKLDGTEILHQFSLSQPCTNILSGQNLVYLTHAYETPVSTSVTFFKQFKIDPLVLLHATTPATQTSQQLNVFSS